MMLGDDRSDAEWVEQGDDDGGDDDYDDDDDDDDEEEDDNYSDGYTVDISMAVSKIMIWNSMMTMMPMPVMIMISW